jgi:hypothetical protein
MEREKQGVQRTERLRQIRLIEDTFASGQFARFHPGDSEKRSAKAAASKRPDKAQGAADDLRCAS